MLKFAEPQSEPQLLEEIQNSPVFESYVPDSVEAVDYLASSDRSSADEMAEFEGDHFVSYCLPGLHSQWAQTGFVAYSTLAAAAVVVSAVGSLDSCGPHLSDEVADAFGIRLGPWQP